MRPHVDWTKYAAHVCGHGDELGTLEPGKLADVIEVPITATGGGFTRTASVDLLVGAAHVSCPCLSTSEGDHSR
jgi:hypothetical protein